MSDKKSGIALPRMQWYVIGVIAIVLILGGLRIASSLADKGTSYQVLGRGLNNSLQLGGNDKTRKVSTFSPLALTKQTSELVFTSAKAGHHHTLLLTQEGDVYTIGDTSPPSNLPNGTPKKVIFPYLKNGERVIQIDTSRDHNIVLTNQGRVYTWGSNYNGQLGDGSNTDRIDPLLVSGLPKIVSVAAGYRHSAVIDANGAVYGWGGSCNATATSEADLLIEQAKSNITALGGYTSTTQADLISNHAEDCTTQASTFVQSKSPQKLIGLQGKATQISAGYGHILVLNDQGDLYSAGCNTYRQLGRAKSTGPDKNDLVSVDMQGKVANISAGYRHSAALLKDGSVRVWGYNGPDGKALLVASTEQKVDTPTQIKSTQTFTAIEAAHDTTFGITKDLAILGWGQDDAKAFWDTAVTSAQNLGTARSQSDTVSGSIFHLLITEAASNG